MKSDNKPVTYQSFVVKEHKWKLDTPAGSGVSGSREDFCHVMKQHSIAPSVSDNRVSSALNRVGEKREDRFSLAAVNHLLFLGMENGEERTSK